jgi:SPP1 family predicted phage head-tail adaptor
MAEITGALNRFIAIQKKTEEPIINVIDGIEIPDSEEVYTSFAESWASIKSVSPYKKRRGCSITESTTHLIKMRYRDDITSEHFILDENGKQYSIEDTQNENEDFIFLLLYAKIL